MDNVTQLLLEQWQQQSIAEIFAVALAIAYVWLAAEESIWCWPAAFISTTLYVYVFWDVFLVFQMFLNAYYMAMAVIGFVHWKQSNQTGFYALQMPLKLHLLIIGGGVSLVAMVSFVASQWLSYGLLNLDLSITLFSLLATYLTVKKYLQSWIYWSIINALSIYLFIQSQLYLTVLLMMIYLVIAIRGYYNWSKTVQTSGTPSTRAQTLGN
jgi:nicotinamide mononucleotide transporter